MRDVTSISNVCTRFHSIAGNVHAFINAMHHHADTSMQCMCWASADLML